MDNETRRVFRATADALGQAAQALAQAAVAFQQAAAAFLAAQTTGQTPTTQRQPSGPDSPGDETRSRLGPTALFVASVVVVGFIVVAITRPPPPPPDPFDGVESGLVFVRCDQPLLGMFRPSIELWGVDPANGDATSGEHTAVELPAHSRLAYPCDTVGGLALRLFDTDLTHAVVQVRTPNTGAEHVEMVALTTGDQQRLTPDPPTDFSPHPHYGLAVFGTDGQTVWYRSANDGTVYTVDPVTRKTRQITTIDPQAVAFTVLTERSESPESPEEIFVQGDHTTDYYATDLALPNPGGDLATADGVVYAAASGRSVALTCAAIEATPTTACLQSDLGGGGTIRPAAWIDDRTLLAISGPRSGVNTVLRVEIDDRGGLRACPALPLSDWSHQAVAVDPGGGGGFVTVAVRDDERMLFYQPADATGDDEPTAVGNPGVPDDANLIAWLPTGAPRSPSGPCG